MDIVIKTADEASLRQLESELVDALDFVRKSLSRFDSKHVSKPEKKTIRLAPAKPSENLTQDDRAILEELLEISNAQFSTQDMLKLAASTGKTPSAVRFFLKQKMKEGKIAVVSVGLGRRPTLYKKTISPTQ